MRWKKLKSPETLTPNEFQKAIIQNEDLKLNYKKFYDSGTEIDAIEFLSGMVFGCNGSLEEKLKCNIYSGLFMLYSVENETTMTSSEFLIFVMKSMKSMFNLGEIQMGPLQPEKIEEYVVETT